MSEVKCVSDHESHRFGVLSQLTKRVLVLLHSNADLERLFSMVRKIVTDQRVTLDLSTVCDLLSAKINSSKPCFDSSHLLSAAFLRSVKTATCRSVRKTTTISQDCNLQKCKKNYHAVSVI